MMTGQSYPDPADEEARGFYHGLELFNAGEWFAAHEAWEEIWHLSSGPRKRFYQGLIQCAVTLEHIRRGNPRGAVAVFASAQTKLRGLPGIPGVPGVYRGVNIAELLAKLERMIAAVRKMPAEVFEPGVSRGLQLPVNLADAPKIELKYDPFA